MHRQRFQGQRTNVGISGNGWVVGNEGIVLHTTDKGQTWEKQESGVSGTLYSVFFVSESTGWAVGDGGSIIHTEDGGATWGAQNSGVAQALRGLFAANDSEAWAAGEGGIIVATRDGGNEWNPQDSGINVNLEAIHFAPPRPGEVVVNQGWAAPYVYKNKPFNRYSQYKIGANRAEMAGKGVYGICNGDFHSEQ